MKPLSIVGHLTNKVRKTYGIIRFLANPPFFNALCRMEKCKEVSGVIISSHVEIPNHWEHLTGDFKCYLFATQQHLYITYAIGKRKCLYCAPLAKGLGDYIGETWASHLKKWDLGEQTYKEILDSIRYQIDAKLRSLAFNLGVINE